MEIIPSIDLKSGLCVRLYQGDYRKETVYSDDPSAVALLWQREGACRLHLVDLDGAKRGEPVNLEVIKSITTQVGIPVQVGGGIRRLETAEMLIDMGVDRVVLGTAAVQDPDLIKRLCNGLGSDKVVAAVDARDGQVATEGWTVGTSLAAGELVQRMTDLGVKRFLYTDISRDGTLTEPNFEAVEVLAKLTSEAILASGGISSMEHIVRLADIGVEGAIVGSALYVGTVDLKAAINAAASSKG